jgi:hypothetical protein
VGRTQPEEPQLIKSQVAKGLSRLPKGKLPNLLFATESKSTTCFAPIEGVRRDTAYNPGDVSSEARQLPEWEPYDDGRCGHL